MVQGQGRTWDGGTAPIGSAGTPTRGGRTSAQAKETAPTWLEEVPSRRDQGTGFGTEHPNLWTKEALIRDLLRWCERQTETGTAPFGVCAADVQVDVTVGSAQSRVNSRRRRLAPTEEGIFMTPTGRRRRRGCWQFWDPRGPPNPVSNVGTRREMPSARGRPN